MNMANAWEYHREHMELAQRSHYVITDGGDQPNVVPSTAAIWFFFRERDSDRVTKMFEDAKQIARGAAPGDVHHARHGPGDRLGVAPALQQADRRGDARERGARRHAGVGREGPDDGEGSAAHDGRPDSGLAHEGPAAPHTRGGGEGEHRHGQRRHRRRDVERCRRSRSTIPANIPGTPGHNWADAIAMATPIAHKGVVAGAKVQAMTLLDLMLQPKLVSRREALLHRRADKDGEVPATHGAERSAGDMVQCGEDGEVPRRDAEVLLRSVEVRDVSPAARDHLSSRICNDAVRR